MADHSEENEMDLDTLIDRLSTIEENDKDTAINGSIDTLISQLHQTLESLQDNAYILLLCDRAESWFLKLCPLLHTSVSSSSDFINSLMIISQALNKMNYFLKCMQENASKLDQYYTCFMDALNNPVNLDYLQGKATALSMDLHADFLQLFTLLAQRTIEFRNRQREVFRVQEWNSHQSYLEERHQPFIQHLLAFIDQHFSMLDEMQQLLSFLVTLSDDMTLIPTLVRCGIAQHVHLWISTVDSLGSHKEINICSSLLLIIDNVARHEEGSNIFKTMQMNQTLDHFGKSFKHLVSANALTIYYMAYALVVTPDELKSATVVHDVIDYLVSCVGVASSASNLRDSTAHMSEYLVALARLVVNDHVAQYMVSTCRLNPTTDAFTFFNDLFLKYNNLTVDDLYLKYLNRIVLFNIFAGFSYQPVAQSALALNKTFVEIIKKASHYQNEQDLVIHPSLLQHLSSIKQAAETILINLDLYKDEDPTSKPNSISTKTTHHVMVSYSHRDAEFCRLLVHGLKSHSIDVWVDEDGHCRSDDCWEEIAWGIKYASFILVIVSPSYCQSPACRKEATYADKRKKSLIAIYPNGDKYEPDEWLDIRLTGTYVRFGGKGQRSFDDSIVRLLEYIQPKDLSSSATAVIPKRVMSLPPLKRTPDEPSKPVKTSSPETTTTSLIQIKPSIHDWTKEEVQTWLINERHLLPELYQSYSFVDGDALLEYARYFLREHEHDPKQQYEKLQKRVKTEHNIDLHDNHYTDLACAMRQILATYDRSLVSTKKATKQGSSMCVIL